MGAIISLMCIAVLAYATGDLIMQYAPVLEPRTVYFVCGTIYGTISQCITRE